MMNENCQLECNSVQAKRLEESGYMTTSTQKNPAVDEFIETLPEHNRELAEHLRRLIFEASDKMIEEFKWSKPSYSHDGLVCYMQSAKTHINFGFYQGAQLADHG